MPWKGPEICKVSLKPGPRLAARDAPLGACANCLVLIKCAKEPGAKPLGGAEKRLVADTRRVLPFGAYKASAESAVQKRAVGRMAAHAEKGERGKYTLPKN